MHIFRRRPRKPHPPTQDEVGGAGIADPPASSRPLDRPIRNLLRALATEVVDGALRARSEALGLDASGSVAAGLVGGEPGLSVQALAERLDRSHSATVRVVDRLEDAGLVERSRSRADARRATLSLTAAGRERLADGTRAADESIDVLLQDLTSGERVLLDRIMAKVAQRLPGDRTAGARVCRFCDPTGCGARGCPRERSD